MKITKIDTDKGTITLQFEGVGQCGPASGDAKKFATDLQRLAHLAVDGKAGVTSSGFLDKLAKLIAAVDVIGDNAK
jgi:hypothetical protein